MRFQTALLLLTLFASAAKGAEVASTVDSVVVYPEGASITRNASVSVAAGANDIVFTGLPSEISPADLRIETGSSNIDIGQIRQDTVQQREAFDAQVAELQARIEAAELGIAVIDDSTKAAELQLQFLMNAATGYGRDSGVEVGRGQASAENWSQAVTALGAGAETAYSKIRDNRVKRKQATEDLSVLQRELASMRRGARASGRVRLALRADRAATETLKITYFVEEADWFPSYEARLDSESGALVLTQAAEVSQRTDEDWTNVTMTLSTSAPTGELEAPELSSEFLDLARPRPSARSRELEEIVVTGALAAPAEDAVVVTARKRTAIDTGSFAASYGIPGRVSLSNESDETQRFDLARYNFNTQLVTQIVPRESTLAFLGARFTYENEEPLYSNGMQVFVDGTFVGTTTMPTALPGAEIVLPMGQDRRVEVRVVDRGGEVGDRGIVGRRNEETTSLLFEVTNRRRSATEVEVFDRYPVARNEDIKVEIPRDATEPSERDVDEEPGVIVWRRSLLGGESWQIDHRYTISYPKNRRLERNY